MIYKNKCLIFGIYFLWSNICFLIYMYVKKKKKKNVYSIWLRIWKIFFGVVDIFFLVIFLFWEFSCLINCCGNILVIFEVKNIFVKVENLVLVEWLCEVVIFNDLCYIILESILYKCVDIKMSNKMEIYIELKIWNFVLVIRRIFIEK